MLNVHLIFPKTRFEIQENESRHIYFLLGPIQGGGDWQSDAIRLLAEQDPGCIVACPKKYEIGHEFNKYGLSTQGAPLFDNQTEWERYYIFESGYHGSAIMYLPEEDKENPRVDGPYAQDTRPEIGRYSVHSAYYKKGIGRRFHLVVGGEENFPGLKTIRKNFEGDHDGPFCLYFSLDKLVKAAVSLAKKAKP